MLLRKLIYFVESKFFRAERKIVFTRWLRCVTEYTNVSMPYCNTHQDPRPVVFPSRDASGYVSKSSETVRIDSNASAYSCLLTESNRLNFNHPCRMNPALSSYLHSLRNAAFLTSSLNCVIKDRSHHHERGAFSISKRTVLT